MLRVVDFYRRKKERPVNVFEVGCGIGNTSRTLKTIWGNDVCVDGITLTSEAAEHATGKFDVPDAYDMLSKVFGTLPSDGVFRANGREIKKVSEIKRVEPVSVRVGLIEGTDIQNQDIIASREAMRYVLDQARALEKVINGLARDGIAVLEVPLRFLSEKKYHITELLQNSGISFRMGPIVEKLVGTNGKAVRWFVELIRKSDTKVDLSPFYEIRTNEEYQNPGYSGE